MNVLAAMRDRARQNLEAAEDSLAKDRLDVAFEEARTAAELYGKALLLQKTGDYPRDHRVGSALHQAGLIPATLDARKLSRLLASYTRGNYGFQEPVAAEEVIEALAMARTLRDAGD